MIEALFVHDVTILNPKTTKDRYDADVADWSDPDEEETRAWISQASRTEPGAGRDVTVTIWRIFLPSASSITAQSRVRWGEATFEVLGVPYPAWTPRGPHHTEADLSLVEG